MSTSQNYSFYVSLYKNPGFQTNFSSSMGRILTTYEDNGDNLLALYSCIGENFSPNSNLNQTLPSPLQQSSSIFYNFWSVQTNVNNVRTLFQAYLLGTQTNEISVDDFSDVNNVVTYILSFLFSTSQYNSSGEPTSYSVDLLNPKNVQPSVENIKNFIQSNVSSSENNLLGAGNYQISNSTSPNTTKPLLPNQGFIYYLCEHLFNLFKNSNNELTGEKLTNTYRFFVSQNTPLLSFCGCFLPEPSFFVTKIPSGFGADAGESPCDPLCYNNNSFKLYENNQTTNSSGTTVLEGGGTQRECNSQVCVIDQTSINSLDSNGNINFNQTCKGCGGQNSSCLCFLDVSPNQLVNKISSGSTGMMTQQNYQQNCPGNSVCFKYIDGVINEVKCNETNTPMTGSVFDVFTDGVTKITSPEYIPDFFWFIVTIIFVLLLLFMYQVLEY